MRHGEQLTLKQFVNFLRDKSVLSIFTPDIKDSEIQHIENSFAQYLQQERGLSQATLDNYLPVVRRLLTDQFGDRKIVFNELHPRDISSFIIHYAHTRSRSCGQIIIPALRNFFRFLYMRGKTDTNLAGAVPTVPRWQLTKIPKILQPEQTKRILQSCDKNTAMGKRDHAILLLIARLGLRAGEIVHLELDDIFWEASELIVRGKSNREERLPLPHDVGQAITTYLCDSRPHCSSRRLFIRMLAPLQGFYNSVAVSNIVQRYIARAGINIDFKGVHLFRHTLATNMLRGGATLSEIGEILRHQLPSTTEIYAKVDFKALKAIALPWAGGDV
ncbi:site-specific integrase [Planctomycetota bacterium]